MTDDRYRRSRDLVATVVAAPFKAQLEAHFLASSREKYAARSDLYRELLTLGWAQLSTAQQAPAPDDGGPFHAVFTASAETPTEWLDWLKACPDPKPVELADIKTICLEARVSARVRGWAGLVKGKVDAKGTFTRTRLQKPEPAAAGMSDSLSTTEARR